MTGKLEGTLLRPRAAPPSSGGPLRRLELTVSPKLDYDTSEISRLIESCRSDTLFFCDTSLFDERTDARVWDALLGGAGSMVIVPPVRLELEPWIAAHPSHVAAKAVTEASPAIQFFTYDQLEEWEINAATYYTNLLSMRKRLVRVEELKFEDAHGRKPNEAELVRLKQDLHRVVGPRGYLLARKGAEKPSGPTFYTDELLVCLAMMTAITAGREVVILTKDEDIQEQFYKLQWLLDTHYRGMLLAELYASDPLGFVFHSLPRNVPHIEEVFQGDNNVLIARSRQLLDDILPGTWSPIAISCAILGEQFTHTTFIAEPGMEQLLRIKGETGGLNTNRLRGRNCHIWLAPLSVPESLRDCAAIVLDRRLPLQSAPVALPLLDIQQTILTSETIPRVIEFDPELVNIPDGWVN
jgi:hypothetical protein